MTPSRQAKSATFRQVAGVALLVVVTLGASARGHVSLKWSNSNLADEVAATLMIALAILGVFAFIALRVSTKMARRHIEAHGGEASADGRRRWALALMTVLLCAGLAALAIKWLRDHGAGQGSSFSSRVGATPASTPAIPTPADQQSAAGLGVFLAALAIVFVVCAVAAFLLWRGRGRADLPPLAVVVEDDDPLHAAVREGAAAMDDIEDPRAAIIACYIAMRGALERAGVEAKRSDTPTEMLARSSAAGVAPAAARVLTALFLEARFSTHPMSARQRQEAVDALDDLAQAAPVAT